jgi:hypothetical protein
VSDVIENPQTAPVQADRGKRRRFNDREENFIFTFFFILATEAFLLLVVYYINVDFLNLQLGDQCCDTFNMWDILTPVNILGFIVLAAIVAFVASRAMD